MCVLGSVRRSYRSEDSDPVDWLDWCIYGFVQAADICFDWLFALSVFRLLFDGSLLYVICQASSFVSIHPWEENEGRRTQNWLPGHFVLPFENL